MHSGKTVTLFQYLSAGPSFNYMHFHHKFFTGTNSRRGHKGQSVKLVNGTLFYIPSLVLVLWLLCVCVCSGGGVEPWHMFLLKRPDKRWPGTMQWQQITVKWIMQTVVWASDTDLWVNNITWAVPLQSCLWMRQAPHATKSTWSVSHRIVVQLKHLCLEIWILTYVRY